MALDWRSNLRELLFGSTPTGFDPDEDQVATDLEHSYYNYRIVRHRAEGDLVANPAYLWSSNAYWRPRGGLSDHLLKEAEALDGVAFTDVLIVISEPDWKRTQARVVTPWDESAREVLAERYEGLLRKNRLSAIAPRRGFQLRILRDGGQELGGERFGLEEGEFMTCLLPHLYHGPVASSTLLAEVFLRLPNWEGEFRKVGALYSDQLGFTVGNHWLDSYQDLELSEPALYHLHHFPDTTRLEHRLNPDLQHAYQFGPVEKGPAGEEMQPVLRIADRGRALDVMLVRPAPPVPKPVSRSTPVPGAPIAEGGAGALDAEDRAGAEPGVQEALRGGEGAREAGKSAPPDRKSGEEPPTPGERTRVVGRGTRIARPGSTLPGEIPAGSRLTLGVDASIGARTIIPEPVDERAVTLTERGYLLQKIHFPQLMAGYTVSLGQTGHIGLAVREPFARIRVEADRVWLDALMPGTFVNGERIDAGRSRELPAGSQRISFGSIRFAYHSLSQPGIAGWPYLGEISRPAVSRVLPSGRRYKIGRNRKACAVVLPDHADQSNILWRPGVGEGDSVTGAAGVIPRDRIYTDSIMVAGEHAELSIEGAAPVLQNLAGRCHVFVRRAGADVRVLSPGTSGSSAAIELRNGDEILLGNTLLRVSFLEASMIPVPAPEAPRVQGRRQPSEARAAYAGRRTEQLGPVGDPTPGSSPADPTPGSSPADPTPGSSPADPTPGPSPLRGGEENPRLPSYSPSPQRGGGQGEGSGVQGEGSRNHEQRQPEVIARDEAAWSMDLRRPGRLILIGWSVAGQVTVGNHSSADVIIPENRLEPGQVFAPQTYFTAYVRGGRGRITCEPARDVELSVRGTPAQIADDLEGLELRILRRDSAQAIDFDVRLWFPPDAPPLPRPRARLLALRLEEHNRGLFSFGLLEAHACPLRLGFLEVQARWTAGGALLESYLPSYRLADGTFRELYWRDGDTWRTAPEDGRPLCLPLGSLLVVGCQVFRVES